MKAIEFDKKFDEGEDISQFLDIYKARRPIKNQKENNEVPLAERSRSQASCKH